MQGSNLANAGMENNNEYVNQLLTDVSGSLSNAQIAQRFDAAMNPAGSLATFTTAYDRASELRQVVREQTNTSLDNHLWAHVTGGKTKLKGISTGGQSPHTDTEVYGLVIGGDAKVGNGVVGAALTAGTGKTENDAVAGKDDFNYYGVSVYGKTTVGSVDLLGDISATWLKSDLTVGNGAAVDTDVTTSVFSAGITAQKTFALGVDVTPFVGLDLYHVRGGSYSNGHGAAIEAASATAVEIPLGTKISKAFATQNGMTVAPEFSFAVVPTLGSKDIDSKVRLSGAESTYNFTYTDDVKLRSRLGVKAEKDNFTFGLNAGYEWGNEERSAASLQANAKYRF